MADEFSSALQAAGFTMIETHISRVFLRGEHVYKIKRSVDLGFLDFTTLEARARACHAEVTLNRRLAPEVYLGVVALTRTPDGALAFVSPDALSGSEVIEWAVHMRRLADADRADVALARGALGPAQIAAIAELVADFHQGARADAETARFGDPELIAQNIEENFTQVAGSITQHLGAPERAALADYQRGFLQRQRALLEERAREGFVRDGHGDLRLEHLYETAGGKYLAIDCIEFNDRFRYADVAADLAFLTMDLAHHGRPELAELLTALYAERTGDFGLYQVLDFYQSYRAFVRAKIASIVADDADVTDAVRARGHKEARRYYLLALAAGQKPLVPPRLIVTFGLIASGKSTLAASIRALTGAPVISADRTRKRLLEVQATTARHEPAFQGAYGAETTERVYAALHADAERVLRAGRSVVLDASFRARAQRERARLLAQRLGVAVLFVECQCPRATADARLARRAEGPSVSDGRAEIFDAFAARFEPADELHADEHLTVDTSRPHAETLDAVRARLGAS